MAYWMQPWANIQHRNGAQQELTKYCLLYKHGGLYRDADTEAVKDFSADMKPGVAMLSESLFGDMVQNTMLVK
jgi:mannosyltransferase OCH1-like enzyme